jgi:sulfite reductase (NADPH) hemoprotein beta-component
MDTPESPVEAIKKASRGLRGTIVESLQDPLTGALREPDQQLIKFHGSYQQDDRDLRGERARQKLEPAYSFMIRTRLPGGVCTPRQWLTLAGLARRYANGTLRLTTRQAFQVHGVIKRDLKPTIQAMNAALIDTIAACGDVNRNVMASANPIESSLHAAVYEHARALSEHLLPHTRAYHEIWLNGEKVTGTPEAEPILGATYLPRKFKAAIVTPPNNDVDVFSQDLGFIAIEDAGALAGFNLTVGGGHGAAHGEAQTFPRLADVVGFLPAARLLDVAAAVVGIQRDFGDRTNRKHARLKYTIADRGIDWFSGELTRRLGTPLAPPRQFVFTSQGDRFGWTLGHDGRWHLTLRIGSGRIADRDSRGERLFTGLERLAEIHRGDFRLTPNQNLIVANVAADARAKIESLAQEYGLMRALAQPPVKRDALACVALPTCPLAMAEAERYLPALTQRVAEHLARYGLEREPITLRLTGCPNGCARPYLSEIALIGRAPGRYVLRLGGDAAGKRLNVIYRDNIDETAILQALDELFARFAAEREPAERFGDFLWRVRVLTQGLRI